MISERIETIRSEISSICKAVGRNPQEVTLIGVTKYTTLEKIRQGIDAGLSDVGENRVQDAKAKFEELGPYANRVKKHLIGHLQSNKAKDAVGIFDIIQSVDSIKLADELEKQAAKINKVIEVFVQVNTSGEEQKSGIEPSAAGGLAIHVSHLQHLRLSGLMTMGPMTQEETETRRCFKDLKQLFNQIQKQSVEAGKSTFRHLSMGMSGDYRIAIEEGATMVRIGRAIFGD